MASFLASAAFAIGGREADLARELGVSRATLSGWKARGHIPEKYRDWFVIDLPVTVLANRGNGVGSDFRNAGVPASLQLLRRTNFNPFGIVGLSDQELVEIAGIYLGGLVRLSHFVQMELPNSVDYAAQGTLYDQVAQIVGEAARRAAPRLLPRHAVSQ